MSKEQVAEVVRLKAYFPYRICFGAISPAGVFEAHARKTMAAANNLVRKGWQVWIL